MMTLLQQRARETEGVLASNLYSDIGPTYYAKLGWKLHDSSVISFDTANSTRMNDLHRSSHSSTVLSPLLVSSLEQQLGHIAVGKEEEQLLKHHSSSKSAIL